MCCCASKKTSKHAAVENDNAAAGISPMKKGIAFAGNLIVDQIKYIGRYPPPHTLATIRDTALSTGGLACNCAMTMAKLDPSVPVQVLGIVGGDEMGEYILRQFSAFPSIDVSGILRMGSTSYTDVMIDDDGGRTFFHYRGANAQLTPDLIDLTALCADILHIGYILLMDGLDAPDPEYETAMCRVLAKARAAGIATSIDVVTEDGARFAKFVPPALAYTDYCIINEMEAERTTEIPLRGENGQIKMDNLRPACEKLIAMGVSRWAVIHMPELSCGISKDGHYVQRDSWKIPKGFKKSSVGAGDAFAVGILYGAYQGWSLDRSIETAGAIAAWSLSGPGATDAVIPLPELMREMEKFQ